MVMAQKNPAAGGRPRETASTYPKQVKTHGFYSPALSRGQRKSPRRARRTAHRPPRPPAGISRLDDRTRPTRPGEHPPDRHPQTPLDHGGKAGRFPRPPGGRRPRRAGGADPLRAGRPRPAPPPPHHRRGRRRCVMIRRFWPEVPPLADPGLHRAFEESRTRAEQLGYRLVRGRDPLSDAPVYRLFDAEYTLVREAVFLGDVQAFLGRLEREAVTAQ